MKKMLLTFVIGLMTMVGFGQTTKTKSDNQIPLEKVNSNGVVWEADFYNTYEIINIERLTFHYLTIPVRWNVKEYLSKNEKILNTISTNRLVWTKKHIY